MVTGSSFTKFMLIVCGIVLMTAAFSGCTDVNIKGDGDSVSAYAQTSSLDLTAPFLEIQNYLDQTDNPLKGTDINVLGSKIRNIATLQEKTPLRNGMTLSEYKWGKTRFEITGKDEKNPYEIIVKYNNGKEIKAIDNHGNADLDIVIGTDKNGNEVFTYPTTADATSTQKQLGGAPSEEPAPTASVSNQALYKQITNPDVIRSAYDKNIDLYRIPASILKRAPDETDSWGTNVWYDVEGFDEYTEYLNDDDKVEKINFKLDENTKSISLADKKQIDGKIDIVWANLDTETISLP